MQDSTRNRTSALVRTGAWASFVAAATAASAPAQMTFSIDYRGPTIGIPSPMPITGAAILTPTTPGGVPALGPLPPPTVVIPGGPGGLGIPTAGPCVGVGPGLPCPAEVDALSYGVDGPAIPGMPPGSYKFSVGRGAIGFPTPVAPNVFSETPLPIGEGASDIFIDLGIPPGAFCPFAAPPGNVAMIDGNGMAGPSPFKYPGTGLIEPHGPNCIAPPSPGDNLDALDVDGPITPTVYFSLDAAGPDACGFPRPGTGPANGFLPGAVLLKFPPGPGLPVVFAPPAMLGLDFFGPGTDDLDALALFSNGVAGFQPSPGPYIWAPMAAPDMLLFSVTATSAVVGMPASNCGVPISPGDVLIPPIPGGLSPFPAIFIAAENLGLATLRSGMGANDELDALDVTRFPVFDCNGNGIEDAIDIHLGGAADCNGNGIPDTCEYTLSSYCTPGTTTNGCLATITGVGTPTASLGCPFKLVCTGVEGMKQGIIFYGISGPAAAPWAPGSTSFLCVKTPVQRMGAHNSFGTAGACDGLLTEDWNVYHTTHPGALGQPLFVGEAFNAQAWFRDPPAPSTTNLSDGVKFTLAP
jgi:hypothetical protein